MNGAIVQLSLHVSAIIVLHSNQLQCYSAQFETLRPDSTGNCYSIRSILDWKWRPLLAWCSPQVQSVSDSLLLVRSYRAARINWDKLAELSVDSPVQIKPVAPNDWIWRKNGSGKRRILSLYIFWKWADKMAVKFMLDELNGS